MQKVVAGLEPATTDYIIKTPSILSAPANEDAIRLTKAAPKQHRDILASCEELKRRTGEFQMIQEVVPGAADSAVGVTMIVSRNGDIVPDLLCPSPAPRQLPDRCRICSSL